jgi:hypothetical protein
MEFIQVSINPDLFISSNGRFSIQDCLSDPVCQISFAGCKRPCVIKELSGVSLGDEQKVCASLACEHFKDSFQFAAINCQAGSFQVPYKSAYSICIRFADKISMLKGI